MVWATQRRSNINLNTSQNPGKVPLGASTVATAAALQFMNTNFILTAGDMTPQYLRALESAKVHELPVVLWHVESKIPHIPIPGVQVRQLDPLPPWLKAQHQCHIFDVLAYQIGYEHGGLVLGLDTISVSSAVHLLGDKEVVVSTDWAPGDPNVGKTPDGIEHPFNNNFIAKKGSGMALLLYEEAKRRILHEPEVWGYTGPILLTKFEWKYPTKLSGAPYPALCGWSPGYVWRFFLGLEPVNPETTHVVHLCRSAYLALYEGRWEDWAKQNPGCAGAVAGRTNINERYLQCP